jgi:hypothetical protein
MKKVVQGVIGNLWEEDLIGWKKWADKFILLNDMSEANPEIPLVGGLNLASKSFREWLINRRPCFLFNRPMLGGWNEKSIISRRISVNSYAATKLGTFSHDRWPKLNLQKNPWKVNEIKNVLIAPPLKSIYFWTRMYPDQWAASIVKQLEPLNLNVKIRYKNAPGAKGRAGRFSTLWNDLEWADVVISYSSAITAEALWYGKKAISLGVCPTWMCHEPSLDDILNPVESINRDSWHNHIAWTQFTKQEWESGEAQELTVQYQGWPLDVTYPDNAFVK